VSLFIHSILFVMGLSAVLAAGGASGVNPANGELVNAVNLLDSAQIRRLFVEMPQILTSFPPLGVVKWRPRPRSP
jgi:aminobenzoyl-glutamate transport protein